MNDTLYTTVKDPDAVLDYTFDWANTDTGPWLPDGDTIVDKTITVSTIDDDETPLVIDSSSVTGSGTAVTIWLSGGTLGNDYTVTCRITTAQGRVTDETWRFLIRSL